MGHHLLQIAGHFARASCRLKARSPRLQSTTGAQSFTRGIGGLATHSKAHTCA